VASDVTLLVRPYPMLAETEFFRALREQPNVRFDEDYRQGTQGPLAHAGCDFRATEPAGAFAGVRALRHDDGA
jgi:hypothetical protein